jgi:hypothetical protein
MDKFSIVMYTHSDYNDIWPIYFGQSAKYISDDIKKYVIADTSENIPDGWEVLEYDDSLHYSARIASCVSQIDSDYMLIEHEDMILYDEPEMDTLIEFVDVLIDSEYDYIKLLKGGDPHPQDIPYEPNELLFLCPPSPYAVQPTIWNTKRFVEFISAFGDKGKNPSLLELDSNSVCNDIKIKGLYSYCGEPKRGMYHWDSDIYPYVATAVYKGKWTWSEYSVELSELFEEYKIDPDIRGKV